MKGLAVKLIHQELTTILGNDVHGPSRIKIWLQRFKSCNLSCNDLPRVGRPPVTSELQLETFLQKDPFVSACVITQHFFTAVLTVKDILQRELGKNKFSRRWVSHSLSDAQKVTHVEASEEMEERRF
jgi:hypothetical protein